MKLETVVAKRAEKTVYRDGDMAIKLFEKSFSKANVLNEALNQARVEETGLNIPKINEVCKIDGKWAIVSDFIEGETLASLMEKNPGKENEYLELFVNLQISIQSKTAPLLNKLKDKMHRKISETTLDATTRYELHMRLDAMHTYKGVSWGLQPLEHHYFQRRHPVRARLVARHTGQRQRRRGKDIPAFQA